MIHVNIDLGAVVRLSALRPTCIVSISIDGRNHRLLRYRELNSGHRRTRLWRQRPATAVTLTALGLALTVTRIGPRARHEAEHASSARAASAPSAARPRP